MNRISGMVMAAGLILGPASVADAQFSLSIGNPYAGPGIQLGQPYGLGVGTTYYGSGYSGYVNPGTTYFSTGTYVPQPYVYGAPVYGVAPRVVTPYRSYGYRNYGYRRGGLRIPFLGGRRW